MFGGSDAEPPPILVVRGSYLGQFADLHRIATVGEPVAASPTSNHVVLMIDDVVRLGLLDRLPWYPSPWNQDSRKVLEEMLAHASGSPNTSFPRSARPSSKPVNHWRAQKCSAQGR